MHPAIARRWGRYRQRLAAGHAALGRREDALRHAVAAVRHLQHCTDVRTELVAAYDIVATCQQELGQLEAAAAARQSAIHVVERTARGTTAWTLALVKLGDLVRFQGHFDEAEEILTRALTDAPTDRDVDEPPVRALVLNALGIVYQDTGRYHAAQIAYAEAFELVATTCAPDDPAVAPLWHNIAGLAHARGHADQAAKAAARAVEIRERALGPRHHLVAQDLAVQGAALLDLGRAAEAEQLFGRALAIFRARHPADQYDVAVNISNLAACRLQRNDSAGAEALFRQGLLIKQAILGGDHPEIARQLNNLAVAVRAQHRLNEASDLYRQALSIVRTALPADHPLTHACVRNLAISGNCVMPFAHRPDAFPIVISSEYVTRFVDLTIGGRHILIAADLDTPGETLLGSLRMNSFAPSKPRSRRGRRSSRLQTAQVARLVERTTNSACRFVRARNLAALPSDVTKHERGSGGQTRTPVERAVAGRRPHRRANGLDPEPTTEGVQP